MHDVAADEPLPADVLATYVDSGRSWVATDDSGQVVGYVIVDIVGDCAHVEQVSVHPAHQGRGVGRALLTQVETWARSQHLDAVTLTTFTDVPWNRPLYEHLGFHTLAPHELSPALRRLREEEAADGLDPQIRVCMAKSVRDRPDRT